MIGFVLFFLAGLWDFKFSFFKKAMSEPFYVYESEENYWGIKRWKYDTFWDIVKGKSTIEEKPKFKK